MKIVQIIRGLDIGGDSGGAELVGVKLAQELAKLPGTKVEVCAFYSVGTDMEKAWQRQLEAEGISTYFVSNWRGTNDLPAFSKGLKALAARLKAGPADVLHAHFQLGSLAALILKKRGLAKKAFRTAHIREEWNRGKFTSLLKPIFIDRAFPQGLDGEIAVSEALRGYLLERRPGKIDPAKVHRFYNAIDLAKIEEDAQSEPELLADLETAAFTLVSVGRLAEQKGYPYLIEAIRRLKDRIPGLRLLVLGDGEDREALRELSDEAGLSEAIRFMGLVPQGQVPAILKKADLFVLASLWEGLPTVVLEAMAVKTPVVATAIPGTVELVEDGVTGRLVAPRDPAALADAIESAWKDPEARQRWTHEAYRRLSQYDISYVARQYYGLYKGD